MPLNHCSPTDPSTAPVEAASHRAGLTAAPQTAEGTRQNTPSATLLRWDFSRKRTRHRTRQVQIIAAQTGPLSKRYTGLSAMPYSENTVQSNSHLNQRNENNPEAETRQGVHVTLDDALTN